MSEWKYFKLNELGVVNRGRSRHRPRNAPQLYGGDYPFIQTADVKKANLYIKEYSQTYSECGLKQSKLWGRGTLCITIAANIAEVGILDIEACFPDSIIGFLADNSICDVFYIKYYFDLFQKTFQQISQGSTQDNLSVEKLLSLQILTPNLTTQQKIAKILSNYDDLIENNLKRIKLLEESARLTYEEWFLRFRINGVQLDIDSETGLPFGWKQDKFHNQLNFKTGKLDSNAVVSNGSYDFYTCAKEIFKTNTSCFNGEAVLLGGNNATGDFALFYAKSKFDAYQRTYIVTSETLPLVYVYFVLKYYLPFFKNISAGAATKFLTMAILKNINIILPELDIIKMFRKKVESIYDEILNLQNQNQLLKEARDILLPRLMTGIINTEKLSN